MARDLPRGSGRRFLVLTLIAVLALVIANRAWVYERLRLLFAPPPPGNIIIVAPVDSETV